MTNRSKLFFTIIVLCIALGLAPFFPEPHLIGKIRWLLGDPSTMKIIDWFDLLMHGAPFLALSYLLISDLRKRFSHFSQK